MKYNPFILAGLCRQSYKGHFNNDVEWKANLKNIFNSESGYTELEFFIVENIQGFALRLDDVRILCFTGTEDLAVNLYNLSASLSTSNNGQNLHTGFLKAFQKIENEIMGYLAKNERLPTVATGHSLGGAIAKIAATRFNDITECTVFGAPPVSDAKLELRPNLVFNQIINQADVIPRIMWLGNHIAPNLITVLKNLRSKVSSSWFFEQTLEMVISNVESYQKSLKEYQLAGRVFILTFDGMLDSLDLPSDVVDICKSSKARHENLGFKNHSINVYEKRLDTLFSYFPLVLSSEKDKRINI